MSLSDRKIMACFVITAISFIFFVQGVFAAPKELTVGVVLGLTGPAAEHSTSARKGIDLAADELREQGWKINLTYEDDQTNATKTVSAIHALLARNIKLFIGPAWSFQVQAARPIYAKAGALAVLPVTSADVSGGAGQGLFFLPPRRDRQIEPIRDFMLEKGLKKAFFLNSVGDWGLVHAEVFKKAAEAAGAEIVGQADFEYGVDKGTLKNIWLKIKSTGADIVLTTPTDAEAQLIVQARNDLQLSTVILSPNNLLGAVRQGLLGARDNLETTYVSWMPIAEDFRRKFLLHYHEPPWVYADRGYDALKILAAAAEQTDGSAAAINEWLKNSLKYPGASGLIDFDEHSEVIGGDFIILNSLDPRLNTRRSR